MGLAIRWAFLFYRILDCNALQFTMKKMKVPGSGRKPGSENVLQRELREQLRLHLANELIAIQGRINELSIVDRYKVAAMLYKLVIRPEIDDMPTNQPVIVISSDL